MEATKPIASSSKSTGDEGASAAAATTTTDNNANDEDFLMFGARPSHLFDNIAITIDSLLTEEVVSLPLLPRTLTDEELRQHQQAGGGEGKPLTGEQKLIAKLRKAYKKNLDLAETYCSRNIFTVQYYSKTKRRKILENFLGEEEDGAEKKDDKKSSNTSQSTTLPTTTLAPIEGEMPTPEQIIGMDKEILVARQRIQQEKQRRIQFKRQLERLNKASQTLIRVQDALQKGELQDDNKLKESVSNAMEGHDELKVWNSRAEEVIQILDKIKMEREEVGNNDTSGKAGGKSAVAGREQDERERKRMIEEIGGQANSLGTKEQVDNLLKKLRGS